MAVITALTSTVLQAESYGIFSCVSGYLKQFTQDLILTVANIDAWISVVAHVWYNAECMLNDDSVVLSA